ncbi:MAG TPA: hypothetical protein VNJ12_05200 [Candidatus Dormibacteraeota bacterium]|nr:hypothetical protein [Candidatus Dormibacteraeota bacterium]
MNRARSAALFVLIGSACASGALAAQTITLLNSSNQTVLSNGKVYIGQEGSVDFPMPELTFSLAGAPCTCDQVAWSISVSYKDLFGTVQPASTIPDATLPLASNWSLAGSSWGSNHVGGTATVTAQPLNSQSADDGPAATLTFYILGTNDTEANVHAYYESEINTHPNFINLGMPWFCGQVLTVESGAKQFCTGPSDGNGNCGKYSPNIVGMPIFGPPDGNGISQVDGTEWGYYGTNSASPWWNWQDNINDGLDILVFWQQGSCDSGTCGYNEWDDAVYDMCKAQPGGVASGGYQAGDAAGTASCSAPLAVPSGNAATTDCGMNYPQGSSPHSLKDAEWVVRYNGECNGPYIKWNSSTDAWQVDYPSSAVGCHQTDYDYLAAVCKAPSY